MQHIGDIKKEVQSKKPPAHPLAASVNEIIAVVGEHKKYNYVYWLKKVKQSKKSYGEILALLKDISNMDPKYPKGATLTNKLKIHGQKN